MPKCAFFCKHFIALDGGEGNKCKAFPEAPGIPARIWDNEAEHDHEIAGQVPGFTFEQWEG